MIFELIRDHALLVFVLGLGIVLVALAVGIRFVPAVAERRRAQQERKRMRQQAIINFHRGYAEMAIAAGAAEPVNAVAVAIGDPVKDAQPVVIEKPTAVGTPVLEVESADRPVSDELTDPADFPVASAMAATDPAPDADGAAVVDHELAGAMLTDAGPTDEAPTEAVLMDEVPTGAVPVGAIPMDAVPVDDVRMDEVPVDDVRMDDVPVDAVQVEAAREVTPAPAHDVTVPARWTSAAATEPPPGYTPLEMPELWEPSAADGGAFDEYADPFDEPQWTQEPSRAATVAPVHAPEAPHAASEVDVSDLWEDPSNVEIRIIPSPAAVEQFGTVPREPVPPVPVAPVNWHAPAAWSTDPAAYPSGPHPVWPAAAAPVPAAPAPAAPAYAAPVAPGVHRVPDPTPTAVPVPRTLADLRTGALGSRTFDSPQQLAVAAVLEGGYSVGVIARLFRVPGWRVEEWIRSAQTAPQPPRHYGTAGHRAGR